MGQDSETALALPSYVKGGCHMTNYGERECKETKVMKPSKVLVKECRKCQRIDDVAAEVEFVR